MSAGMVLEAGFVCATTSGASTRLNRTPVRLLKTKREMIANGAYFRERNKGNFRDNFIRYSLHVNDGHKAPGFWAHTFPWGSCVEFQTLWEVVINDRHSDGSSAISVALFLNFYAAK